MSNFKVGDTWLTPIQTIAIIAIDGSSMKVGTTSDVHGYSEKWVHRGELADVLAALGGSAVKEPT